MLWQNLDVKTHENRAVFRNSNLLVAVTECDLCSVASTTCPIVVSASLPPYGIVRSPIVASYRLQNCTADVLSVELDVDAAEAFMFSGQKHVSKIFFFFILPYDI